jgi:hypothetical protein
MTTRTYDADVEVAGVDYCLTYTLTLDEDAPATALTKVERYDEDDMTELPLADLDPALRAAFEARLEAMMAADLRALAQDEEDAQAAAFGDYIDRLIDEQEDR